VPYFVAAPLLIQDIKSWFEQGIGGLQVTVDRLRDSLLNIFERGAATAEDAQGIPTQGSISPSILLFQEFSRVGVVG
jgi:hypothetical protein